MSPFSVLSSGAPLAGPFPSSGADPDAGETPALQDTSDVAIDPGGDALKGQARIAQGNALG